MYRLNHLIDLKMGPYGVNNPDHFSNGEFLNGLSVNICSNIFRHSIKSPRVESSQPQFTGRLGCETQWERI